MQSGLASYTFGEFVLDTRSFRLLRAGVEVPLEPKALNVLVYLVQRPNELVTKETLFRAVWPDAAVTDNALTRVVMHLRRALADEARDPRYIETVPTRGYRFIGTVSATPEAQLAAKTTTHRSPLRRYVTPAATLALPILALVGLLAASRWNETAPGAQERVRSLAVLPLKNLTGRPEEAYLVDGMTEALRTSFSDVGLSVVAVDTPVLERTSGSPARVAHTLGVDGLFEGSVFRRGDRVRLEASLLHGASERRLWSGTYERSVGELLTLYRDLALSLATEVRASTNPLTGAQTASRSVVPGAYEAYLRGTYLLGNRWMSGGCTDAERYLLQAIEADPQFAAPYAALAWCYAYPDRIGRDITDVGPKAKTAVAKALQLDARLAMAHVVNGTILWRVDYRLDAAEAAFRNALALDSNLALAYLPYAELLIWTRGERERGVDLLRRALQLEPFSVDRNVQVGFILLSAGLYDAALAQLEKAAELDAEYPTARLWIAEARAYKREHADAVADYLKWLEGALIPARAAEIRASLARAYTREGWLGFWRRELEFAEADARRRGSLWQRPYHRYTGPWYMARRYARLGDKERALQAVQRAFAARHHMVATLPVDPLFAAFKTDPRFQELLRAIGAHP